ncbi:MAG: Ureidoglycolate hydrolase [Oscillatoriales cyanobacterium RM2_1_1]|nr:Ureidoglycolate hydrolase [Oscillatoriales cyanobacterium SM2_3_0]NJO47316.1 Ureidoglycolate hydrolase [Oscillatoriales cyanobacterium RM2_1_1]
MDKQITTVRLQSQPITVENFKPYGQLITASDDGKAYDQGDAQLDLANGIPRFYIMRLNQKGLKFHRITRHSQCTQCLGSLEGKSWLIAVASPNQAEYPDLDQLNAFQVPGNCFIKLEVGTWHAGPYFTQEFIDFYNLELSDTNVVDHFTYDFRATQMLEFEIS